MAQNIRKITAWTPQTPWTAWCFAIFLASWTVMPFLSSILLLFQNSEAQSEHEFSSMIDSLLTAAYFSLKQAGASASLVFLGAPGLALALLFMSQRQRYWTQVIRITLFCLPSIVVASGLVTVWGNQGYGTQIFSKIGFNLQINKLLYSPYAVIIANVLMNLPFTSIVVFNAITTISEEQIQSIKSLGLSKWSLFRSTIWPIIRGPLLYSSGLTFLLSLNSFGSLSILGGTPESQTLEMGIYQKIFFDGQWSSATLFSIAHTLIAGLVGLLLFSPKYRHYNTNDVARTPNERLILELQSLITNSSMTKRFYSIASLGIDFLLSLPVAIVFFEWSYFLISNLFKYSHIENFAHNSIFRSLLVSLSFAIPAAAISCITAWIVAGAFCRYQSRLEQNKAKIIMIITLSTSIVPSMSAAFGVLALRSHLDFLGNYLPIVFLHAAMILPFLLHFNVTQYNRYLSPFILSKSILGVKPKPWLSIIELPRVLKVLPVTLALGICLSVSETSIVTMLNDSDRPALTSTMIQLMSRYRFEDSALGSSILVIATLVIIALLLQKRSDDYGKS